MCPEMLLICWIPAARATGRKMRSSFEILGSLKGHCGFGRRPFFAREKVRRASWRAPAIRMVQQRAAVSLNCMRLKENASKVEMRERLRIEGAALLRLKFRWVLSMEVMREVRAMKTM